MSFKRRVEYQYKKMLIAIATISLPAWVNGLCTRLILAVLVVGFSFAYMVQISSMATQGYQMHNLESQTAVLNADLEKISVQLADAQSISSIHSRLNSTGLMAVSEIIRYDSSAGALAKR